MADLAPPSPAMPAPAPPSPPDGDTTHRVVPLWGTGPQVRRLGAVETQGKGLIPTEAGPATGS